MYGIFWLWAFAIFTRMGSFWSYTSTRPPASASFKASSWAASLWRSASGSTATCTGASHSGSAPA